eukprot:8244870-Alexandrium_andersonii.AAC.1
MAWSGPSGPCCSTGGGSGPEGLRFCIFHGVIGTINVLVCGGAGAGGGRTPACLSCFQELPCD